MKDALRRGSGFTGTRWGDGRGSEQRRGQSRAADQNTGSAVLAEGRRTVTRYVTVSAGGWRSEQALATWRDDGKHVTALPGSDVGDGPTT